MAEDNKLIEIAFLIIVLGIVVVIGVQIMDGYREGILTTNSTSTTQNILSDNSTSTTLTPIGEGITSSSFTSKNQTWLEFDGVNDSIQIDSLVTDISVLKNFTICGWFNNTGVTGLHTIFASSISTSDRMTIQYSATGRSLRAGIYNGSEYVNNISIDDVRNDTWNGFCYSCTENGAGGGICNISSNRTEGIGSVATLSADSATISIIGRRTGKTDGNFSGFINNIIIFNKTLIKSEKNALEINRFNDYVGIDLTLLDTAIGDAYINDSGVIYGYSSPTIVKSLDNGTSWSTIYTFTEGTGTDAVFVDSRNTIFAGRDNTGSLYLSMGNDTNWTSVPAFTCNQTGVTGSNGTFWGEGMVEDSGGNLYLAEYASGYENCSYIHKSTNGGLNWSVIYNSTDYGTPARHTHMIKLDPYTGYLYASQGDGPDDALFIRSVDNGTTWITLQSETSEDWTDGVDAQYTTMEFVEGCRILGTDAHNPNRIIKTCDDVTFINVLNLSGTEDNYIWRMSKDNEGNLYAGVVSETIGNYGGMWFSSDDGDTWNKVLDVGITFAVQKGINHISNFYDDFALVYDNTISKSYRMKLQDDSVLRYELNENSGTTAYDVSGSGNNGIIDGATWNDDGVDVALTQNTDYTLIGAIFTVINNDYAWTGIDGVWNYTSNIVEAADYALATDTMEGLAEFENWFSILVILGIAGVIITLVIISFGNKQEGSYQAY